MSSGGHRDPAKRLSCAELLQHPWFCGEASTEAIGGGAAGGGALPSTIANLRRFNAKRKFREAISIAVSTDRLRWPDGGGTVSICATPSNTLVRLKHAQVGEGKRQTDRLCGAAHVVQAADDRPKPACHPDGP